MTRIPEVIVADVLTKHCVDRVSERYTEFHEITLRGIAALLWGEGAWSFAEPPPPGTATCIFMDVVPS